MLLAVCNNIYETSSREAALALAASVRTRS